MKLHVKQHEKPIFPPLFLPYFDVKELKHVSIYGGFRAAAEALVLALLILL